LRQFIAKNALETSEAVATMKAEYFESVRRRNYETSRRIYAGIAERLAKESGSNNRRRAERLRSLR
jgi:hypothetical protein